MGHNTIFKNTETGEILDLNVIADIPEDATDEEVQKIAADILGENWIPFETEGENG